VAELRRRQGYRRGYPVAVLIGFEENHAAVWRVFSNVVKPDVTVELEGNRRDEKTLYNFHESIINALRLMLKEGVRSIVIVAPIRTNFADVFLDHVKKHHSWMVQGSGSKSATFGVLVGSAGQLREVAGLVKTEAFRELIGETTSEEADRIVVTLEKSLNDPSGRTLVLYSVKEIEDLVFGQFKLDGPTPEYLMLTDRYMAESKEKNRIHRLLQIAKNKRVKTITVKAETNAGKRLTQLGGLVCLAPTKQD
jgi:stalled ribosome rescue protein Dom34